MKKSTKFLSGLLALTWAATSALTTIQATDLSGVTAPVRENVEVAPTRDSQIRTEADVPLLTLNNETQLPQLGLGTQIQRLEGDASEQGRALLNQTSREAVATALRDGYRHLDTASGYFNEEGVGQGIRDSQVPREEIWLTTKIWPSDYGRGTTMAAIDRALERLQVDYLDMVYLHHPVGDYVGAWQDLEEAYRQGKIRALGISNFDNEPEALQAILEQATIRPQALQIELHPLAQRRETRELAARYQIQVEAWYPLGHADAKLMENATLLEIASKYNKTVPQVILRWLMQEGIAAVPGSTNPDHIAENLAIFDFELSDDDLASIRNLDQGDAGRYFNLNYQELKDLFLAPRN